MQTEEKNLLLRDLCARLPYGVFVEENRTKLDPGPVIYIYDYHPCIDNCKPYLRPMSSMTEDEAMKVVELCVCSPKDVLSVSVKQDCISVEVDDGVVGSETYTIWFKEIVSSIELFDWLNAHHFDYRGLIPMGLALEAPEGMYKN